ncbi:pyrophosphohydrolase domain-containing protein [Streptomyces luteogriseus]|uniref:hypothetical protein n=1 Tax=Streptomyces luteogriseus TaxID=68233 RepID=UPI00378FB996
MSLSSHVLSAVGAFHRAVGVDRLSGLDQREQLVMVALRATLIAEEATEYWEALGHLDSARNASTLQHAAKEAADLLYVLAGTADVLGVSSGGVARVQYPKGSFLRDQVLRAQIRILVDELTHLGRLIHHREDTLDAVDALAADLHHVACSLQHSAVGHGIPLQEAFDAVHASNMSKINPETNRPFERREDGKVLKGPSYREADLSWLQAA